MRDFFWDDDFRLKWDDMLLSASALEECPTTGIMMVQWVRKVRILLLCIPFHILLKFSHLHISPIGCIHFVCSSRSFVAIENT